MIVAQPVASAEQLLALPKDGNRYALVKGELRQMAPAGEQHGRMVMPIAAHLYAHVATRQLGTVYGAETGFLLAENPDTVRAPDVAFVQAARRDEVRAQRGYARGAPDLAIEVVSPGDVAIDVEEKILQWLDAGARLVIVIHPRTRTVTVYRSRTQIQILSEGETLHADDVVPGWTLPVAEVFAQG